MTQKGTLFVVGTPIGNLEDITLRAIRILKEVDVIAAEDTRVTAKLNRRHNISTPLLSFREQNAGRSLPKIINRLEEGLDVALVTDAGTPSVSDPGVDLVAAASQAGIDVTPIPGASALAAGLSVAGLKGQGVRFLGFLPRSGRRRTDLVQAIASDTALTVLYESPNRLKKTLTDLADVCDPRQAVVLRELTKRHEEIARGTLKELKDHFADNVLGEVTIVLAGSTDLLPGDLTDDRLRELVQKELAKGRSAKDTATALSRGLGLPRKKVYEIAINEMTGS